MPSALAELTQIKDYQPKARTMDKQDNFTQLPNEFFDYHMPRMKTASEMKVVLVVARRTIGWQKTEDCLSLSQFVQATGLNREEVTRGLNAAIKHGSIERRQKGDSFVYTANLVGKTDYGEDISDSRKNRLEKVIPSRKNRLELVGKTDQKEPLASRKNRHTKETNLNKDLNKGETSNEVAANAALEPLEITPTNLNSNLNSDLDMPPAAPPPDLRLVDRLDIAYRQAATQKDKATVIGEAFSQTFRQQPHYGRLAGMWGKNGLNSGWKLIELILSLTSANIRDDPHDYLQKCVNDRKKITPKQNGSYPAQLRESKALSGDEIPVW